jgi:N utilization substance protein B
MANRHLSRSLVLQTLFEWDFTSCDKKEVESHLVRNIQEFGPDVTDMPFMKHLLETALEKQADLDKVIEKAAPEWPIEKISIVDRNILRMGLSELLFSNKDEVPAKVAINEAIELAKTFGGESSGKFINGVLGAVYREMGEPGKDDVARPKKKDIPYEEMPIETKVGALVYTLQDDIAYLALVHDVFGHWTLSKGGLEAGENDSDGLKRVIKEEMGIEIEPLELLGENEYIANHPEKGKHRKQVKYFLAKANFNPLTLGSTGGLDDAKWFKLSEILDLNFYDDIVSIITKGIEKMGLK